MSGHQKGDLSTAQWLWTSTKSCAAFEHIHKSCYGRQYVSGPYTHRHTGEASWASSWALPHGMKEVQRAGMGGGRQTTYIDILILILYV